MNDEKKFKQEAIIRGHEQYCRDYRLSAIKAGSHIIAANVSIAAVNSKSGLTIGTII